MLLQIRPMICSPLGVRPSQFAKPPQKHRASISYPLILEPRIPHHANPARDRQTLPGPSWQDRESAEGAIEREFITLKITVLAPIPKAKMATAVKAGLLLNNLNAKTNVLKKAVHRKVLHS